MSIPNTFTIRTVLEKDAAKISEINRMCWQTAYRGLIADEILDGITLTSNRLERFRESIRETQIYLCAEKEGAILGYIAGGKPNNKQVPYPFEVYYLYIHPDFQGQGIGTGLMAAFQKKINYQPFCVFMLDGNEKALTFYQKQGGVRCPQYDTDVVIRNNQEHDVCLGFEGKKL